MEYNCMKCIVDDFKHSLCEDGYCERFYGMTGDLIDLIPRWIPCSESLPDVDGKYLISVIDGIRHITTTAMYQPRYKTWDMMGKRSHWRVIAWMPLPKPYKDGEQNES